MLVSSAVLRHAMLKQGKGQIINVSSRAGKVGLPHMGPYVASKFALEGLTATMAAELDGVGIPPRGLEATNLMLLPCPRTHCSSPVLTPTAPPLSPRALAPTALPIACWGLAPDRSSHYPHCLALAPTAHPMSPRPQCSSHYPV
jgi:hypothetical protein